MRGTYKVVATKEAKAILVANHGEFFASMPKDVEVRVPMKAKRMAGIGIWLNGIRVLKIKARLYVTRKELVSCFKVPKGIVQKSIAEGRLIGFATLESIDWPKIKELSATIPSRSAGISKVKETAAALLAVSK